MYKILIVARHMRIGGIQKSLSELLRVLSNDNRYDITLFCCCKSGEFLNSLPSNVHILNENPYAATTEMSSSECIKKGLRYAIFRIFASGWSKLFSKSFPVKILSALVGEIPGEYDVAISYAQPTHDKVFCGLGNELVLNCTKAARKIGFVHCDFANYGGNTPMNRELYLRYDAIASVSHSVGKVLGDIIPNAKDKIHTVYNICDAEKILSMSGDNPVQYEGDVPVIVTVARLGEEKGHLRCIPIFLRLKKEGLLFNWHIVGGGEKYDEIQRAISDCGLTDSIILEGEQNNPYRYMKNADYFFLPSLHEAAPVVFQEAQALGIPILTTNTLSADEMVGRSNTGLVCDNNDEAIYHMLKKALCDKTKDFERVVPDLDVSKKQFEELCFPKLS